MRPDCLVLVTGTGTDVGKTWVAAALAKAWLGGGATVAARKPVLSFDPTQAVAGDEATAGTRGGAVHAGTMVDAGPGASAGASADEGATDGDILAAATGESAGDVCPEHRRYPVAMAPPIAAATLGRPAFTVAELAAELRWPSGPAVRYGLVEGVGGPRSPLAADGDTIALAELLEPDHVVLVADAGLGAINAVLLCAAALAPRQPAVLLNRFDEDDPVHVLNIEWLRRHTDLAVMTDVAELAARW